jgi:hypothetical protein
MDEALIVKCLTAMVKELDRLITANPYPLNPYPINPTPLIHTPLTPTLLTPIPLIPTPLTPTPLTPTIHRCLSTTRQGSGFEVFNGHGERIGLSYNS